MHFTDKLFLHRLAQRHNIDRNLDDALRKAEYLDDKELRRLGRVLVRLPERMLRLCMEHPRLADVIEHFADVSGLPRLQALAFLKLGVPVRGVVLPELLREHLNVVVYAKGRRLFVNGQPVRLRQLNYLQVKALRRADIPLIRGVTLR